MNVASSFKHVVDTCFDLRLFTPCLSDFFTHFRYSRRKSTAPKPMNTDRLALLSGHLKHALPRRAYPS